MEDEYATLHNTVPTDPKKLVEQLTKIETKIRTIKNEDKSGDRRKGGPIDDPHRRSRSGKNPNAKGKGHTVPEKTIPRKQLASTAKETSCKLCAEYGGVAKTHTTAQCKKWVPGGKSHPDWRGGKTANINVHKGTDVNQLMAQQIEFQSKIMNQMNKLTEKKKSKKEKKRRRRYASDSDSEDSD